MSGELKVASDSKKQQRPTLSKGRLEGDMSSTSFPAWRFTTFVISRGPDVNFLAAGPMFAYSDGIVHAGV